MALFDVPNLTTPLPNFDVSMPRIDTQSFLPNFEAGMDVFGPGFNGGSLFDGFQFANGFGSNDGFYSGSRSDSPTFSTGSSFRGFLPIYGSGGRPASSYTFPWDKPPTEIPTVGSGGGIGSATGGFSALNAYDNAFMQAAAAHGGGKFDANWLKAMAMMEGGWGAGATSGAGALGIMQIMPGGYPDGERLYPNWRTDPTQNIMLGAYILAQKIAGKNGSRDEGTKAYLGVGTDPFTGVTVDQYLANITNYYNDLLKTSANVGTPGAPFTGQAGSSYLSIFGGQNYPISSYNGVSNGMPASWYAAIDDEYGLPVGTHAGLDVAMPSGTKLYMPKGMTGVVEVATGENGYGYDPNGGVARSGPQTGELLIRLSNGHIIILGHMQTIYVRPGQTVTGGQNLGLSGGAGSGPHVHFEYRIPGNTSSGWISVDPRSYLR